MSQRKDYISHKHPMAIVVRTSYFDSLVSCRKENGSTGKTRFVCCVLMSCGFSSVCCKLMENDSMENVTRRIAIITLVMVAQELLFLPLIGLFSYHRYTDASKFNRHKPNKNSAERMGKHL